MGDAPTVAAVSPKLLELDKEDVNAVRSFLPGRILGRTAALLALGVLCLRFHELFNVGIGQFIGFQLEPRWLKNTLLFEIPVLIVGAQIAAEWAAERKRRQTQALAIKIEAVPEGYFRVGPYLDTAEDRAKFDRADRIHEKVLDWLKRADAIPLYLTGDSGSGKSSALNAYALPGMREAGWAVIEARAWQDPEGALTEAIAKLASARKWQLGEATNLRGALEALARRADDKLLLVLDQVEEFVILAGSERQQAFIALINDLRTKPVKGLKLLLVLRSDYKTALDELGLPLLRQGENWQEVGRLTIAAGTKFMARSGLGLQSDALDRVVTSAAELDDSPGMIRPITLNVVGYVLSAERASAPSLDAGQLVRHYIEQSVEQPAIREMAPRVLKELVTEQGTKWPRSEKELVEQTHLRPAEVRAVMNGFSAAALARPLDAAQGVWEFSHDFVARAVARYLERRRLDWPGIARAYAAPALFVLMAATAAGAIAWNVNAADRARPSLAELGVEVLSTPDGLEAIAGSRFKSQSLPEADSLLAKLPVLRVLDLSRTEVANVEPLKGLTGLLSLDLSRTEVASVEPLKGLTALQSLDLVGTNVTDLRPLEGLTELKSLTLFDTPVADLEPLKGLTGLQSLNLDSTQVAEVEPLKGLTALQSLDLSFTDVVNVQPLKGLTALRSLDLSNTPVANVEPLKGLTGLRSLDLSNTQIADIAPLKDLTALRSLDLSNTQVANVDPLKGQSALQSLNLFGTKIANVEPLKGLTGLLSLNLNGTQVANVEPLKGLTALRELNLNSTQVANLDPLKGLSALETLDLNNTRVANVEPLKGLTALRELNLYSTQVANLEPLKALSALETLDLNGTQVANVEPLKGLTALRELNLNSTQVANLEPLKALSALETLDLNDTQVANVEPLKGLTALRELNLNSTQVANLEPLKGLTALRTLDLSATKVADLTPLQDLPNLTKVNGVSDEELKKLNAYRGSINLPLVK